MAKKQQNPFDDPPTASSNDDDEVQHSKSAEEDSSSDEESSKNLQKASDTEAASDSDSGSDTETDSGSKATNPSKSGKSVSVAAVSTGKPSKKDLTSSVALPPAKSGTKRPASEGTPSKEDNSTKRAKRTVITSEEEGESMKKPAFQRKWTEDAEISVLGGMIDFKADTGKSPYDDTNEFYESVKKSITFEVSKNQFMDKIRSLKKKFFGNELKNGAKPSFAKAHDLKIYKLSKQIWGPDGIALESNIKSSGVSKKSESKKKKLDKKQELVFVASSNGKKVEDDGKVSIHGGGLAKSDWFAESFLVRSIAAFGVDEDFVKQKRTLVPLEEKKKIEEKWKQLQAKEFQFVLEKTDFVHGVTTMIVEASKNKPFDI